MGGQNSWEWESVYMGDQEGKRETPERGGGWVGRDKRGGVL